ncbi:MAG TPA: hypothetical protein IAA29_00725 [Candidatus Paenibacillus intestinavium]|nr:hypothetical protein [Candidatus Paenibacillus intestinavium]
MLEVKTSQKVNELIRGMTEFCIRSYKSDQSVSKDDLEALANLIEAVNTSEQAELTSVVGFVVEPVKVDDDE